MHPHPGLLALSPRRERVRLYYQLRRLPDGLTKGRWVGRLIKIIVADGKTKWRFDVRLEVGKNHADVRGGAIVRFKGQTFMLLMFLFVVLFCLFTVVKIKKINNRKRVGITFMLLKMAQHIRHLWKIVQINHRSCKDNNCECIGHQLFHIAK